MKLDLEKQPGKFGTQHAHLVMGSKSIFFNERESRKGSTYLKINSSAGDYTGTLSLFENQLKPFIEVLLEIADRWGIDISTGREPTLSEAGFECPYCGKRAIHFERGRDGFGLVTCYDGHEDTLEAWAPSI